MIKKEDDVLFFTGKVQKASSFAARLQGLMFKKRFPPNYDALTLFPCNAVHTMFMRFAIDVLFLNADDEIVALYPGMRPWHFTSRIRNARLVMEMPAGTIERFGISRGNLLLWQKT